MALPVDIERKCYKYLEPVGWSHLDVCISFMKFSERYGDFGIQAMGRFIQWAVDNDKAEIIPVTISHDLSHCDDECFSPRTIGY